LPSTTRATTRITRPSNGRARTAWIPTWRRAGSPTNRGTGCMQEVRPTWATWREALAVVRYRPHLLKTIRVALIVGTIIFAINQLDVVLRHKATLATYMKCAVTYLVPF